MHVSLICEALEVCALKMACIQKGSHHGIQALHGLQVHSLILSVPSKDLGPKCLEIGGIKYPFQTREPRDDVKAWHVPNNGHVLQNGLLGRLKECMHVPR